MTIRKIATVGHPVLRQRAREVPPGELASPELQRLIDDLIDTMRDANGAGIAANQVHEPVRVAVIEVDHNRRYPYKPPIPLTVLVNPVIEPLDDELVEINEGCLSVPNLRGSVLRAWMRVTPPGLPAFAGGLRSRSRRPPLAIHMPKIIPILFQHHRQRPNLTPLSVRTPSVSALWFIGTNIG